MTNPTLRNALAKVRDKVVPDPDRGQAAPDDTLDDSDLTEISGGLMSESSCPTYEP